MGGPLATAAATRLRPSCPQPNPLDAEAALLQNNTAGVRVASDAWTHPLDASCPGVRDLSMYVLVGDDLGLGHDHDSRDRMPTTWPRLLPGLSALAVCNALLYMVKGAVDPTSRWVDAVTTLAGCVFVAFLFWMRIQAEKVYRAGRLANVVDRHLVRYASPVFAYLAIPACVALVVAANGAAARAAEQREQIGLAVCAVAAFGTILTMAGILRQRVYVLRFLSIRNLSLWVYLLSLAIYMACLAGVLIGYVSAALVNRLSG